MKKIAAIFIIIFLAKWWFTDPSIHTPTNDITFNYIVKYSGTGRKDETLPMLVALHGNQDTTENFYETALNQFSVPVRIILLEGPINGNSWPWSTDDFRQYGDAINEAIELLSTEYPTVEKPILFGFSGGAMMAYYQAIKHGKNYAHIFAVSGKLSKDWLKDSPSNPGAKVSAYHGKGDKVISVNHGRNAVDILKSKGVNVNYTEFEGGHLGLFRSMKPEITNAIESKILNLN